MQNRSSKIDYSLNTEMSLDQQSLLIDQRDSLYLERLLSARQYVDRSFQEQFGVCAYPYLDILLIGLQGGDSFDIDPISQKLTIPTYLVERHLSLMIDLGMIATKESKLQVSEIGKDTLLNIVGESLSTSFDVIEK